MQIPEPHFEHMWLHQLVGEWSVESECIMGPDQPPTKTTGREVVRNLGKLWTIGEGTGDASEGGCDSIMTLGYDPQAKRFVGSFVTSAMTHFWPYTGSLDASKKVLTLDSEGPSFSGDGTMATGCHRPDLHNAPATNCTADEVAEGWWAIEYEQILELKTKHRNFMLLHRSRQRT